jgi:hypothetical protein
MRSSAGFIIATFGFKFSVHTGPRTVFAALPLLEMRRRPPTLRFHPDITERNEPPAALIPQYKPNAAKALKQREPTGATQIGIVPKRLRQPVIRYPATQMVDVVHADVRCEPA